MEPRFKGILFDMDGTLTEPSFDFDYVRRALDIEPGTDIVKAIEAMPEGRRAAAWEVIDRYEEQVRADTRIKPGVGEALRKFREAGVKLGILTRNTFKSVEAVLAKLDFEFDAILTREFPSMKPSPEPALHMFDKWGMSPAHGLVVGDYKFDIECGRDAGASTCFFENEGFESFAHMADFCVRSFGELESIVLSGIARTDAVAIERATLSDAGEILALQKLAFLTEAELYGDGIQPLHQTMEEIRAEFDDMLFLKAHFHDGRIVGSVRARMLEDGSCWIGKLIVHPDFRRRGIGAELMRRIEACFPSATRFELFTGARSEGNISLYKGLGYREFKRDGLPPILVPLEKLR